MAQIGKAGKINVLNLRKVDPEKLRAKFISDPYKWFTMPGAKKHLDLVVDRVHEILDMSKWFGLDINNDGTYTFCNTTNTVDKFTPSGKLLKKGLFGLLFEKDDYSVVNKLAYYAINKMIYDKPKKQSKIKIKLRSFSKYIY